MTSSNRNAAANRLDLQSFGRCPDCGKLRYLTRKAARLVIRRMRWRDGRLSAYRCGDWWHIGHTPGIIRRGEVSRAEFDPTRRRPRPRQGDRP